MKKYSKITLLGIGFYIFFNIFINILGHNTKTVILTNEFYEFKMNKKVLVIRNEEVIKSDVQGYGKLVVNNNEKVKKNQVVMQVYENNLDFTDKINKLNDELLKLESQLENNESKISSEIIKNQINLKKEEIKNTQEKNKCYDIKANSSGFVFYDYDGNEEKYGSSNLEDITKEDIENANNDYKKIDFEKVKYQEPILRVVDVNNCFICIYVSDEEAKNFEKNQKVKISYDDTTSDCIVTDISKKDDYFLVIMKINDENKEIYDTRTEKFDIIYRRFEALKVPKSSVKVIDNKKGVYVVNQENKNVEFVELKGIEYEDDDYLYINYNQNRLDNVKTVDLYDEIILNPNIINSSIKIK